MNVKAELYWNEYWQGKDEKNQSVHGNSGPIPIIWLS